MSKRAFTPQHFEQAEAVSFHPDFFNARKEVPGITIDPPGSRDLDDAIWIEPRGQGYRLQISIADVSAAVGKDSILDKEALERGFTRYRGWGNVPMIPHTLSENKLSLLEGKKRPTITVTIDLDENLRIANTELSKSFLISNRRMNYKQANQSLNEANNPLHAWGALAQRLRAKRRSEGAMIFDNRKKGLIFNGEQGLLQVEKGTFDSHILIEEMMVLANHAVASKMAQENVPFLFRCHEGFPDAQQRGQFMHILQDILEGDKEITPSNIAAIMQAMPQRARYTPEKGGHAGLSLSSYCHFTSPIRRYADLVDHHIVSAYIDGAPHPYKQEELQAIGDHINILVLDDKKSRSRHLRDMAMRGIDTQIKAVSPDQMAIMPTRDFTKIIERCVETDVLHEGILTAYKERAGRNALTSADMYQALVEAKSTDGLWSELKAAALAYLEAHPHDAYSVLNMTKQSQESFDFREEATSLSQPGKPPVFGARVVAIIDGEEFTARQFSVAGTKKDAAQNAALEFWRDYHGGQLVPREEITLSAQQELQHGITLAGPIAAIKTGGTIKVPGKNPISRLMELQQKYPQLKLEEAYEERGAAHTKQFRCTYTVSGPGIVEPTTVNGEWMSPKQDAKADAAQALLAHEVMAFMVSPGQVPQQQPAAVKTHVAAISGSVKNPISRLMELQQKYRQLNVEEALEERGADHTKEFRYTYMVSGPGIAQPTPVSGEWTSPKQDAKANAAQALLAHEALAFLVSPGRSPTNVSALAVAESTVTYNPLRKYLSAGTDQQDPISRLNAYKNKFTWNLKLDTQPVQVGDTPMHETTAFISGNPIGVVKISGSPSDSVKGARDNAAHAFLNYYTVLQIGEQLPDGAETRELRSALDKTRLALLMRAGNALQAAAGDLEKAAGRADIHPEIRQKIEALLTGVRPEPGVHGDKTQSYVNPPPDDSGAGAGRMS